MTCSLLLVLSIFLQPAQSGLREDDLINLLWQAYNNESHPAFSKYHLSMFYPMDGPYYRKLAKLGNPIAFNMAANGFPSGRPGRKNAALAYTPLERNKVIYDGNQTYTLDEDVPMDSVLEGLLLKYINSTDIILEDEEFGLNSTANLSEWSLPKKIRFAEFQRPRSLLAFSIDIYRVCVELTSTCQSSSRCLPPQLFKSTILGEFSAKCLVFFNDYSHLLATYTLVVCKHLTAVSHYDVDHICPNLCLPRANPPWMTSEEVVSVKDIDVCSQISNALPGTCQLIGLGIYDNEFRCQCVSAAYTWKAEEGDMLAGRYPRCEPLFPELEKLPAGSRRSIPCIEAEINYFCNPIGSKGCTFLGSRETYANSNKTVTKISLWPTCECRSGFGGIRCERRFDVCEDPLPLSSAELKALQRKVKELPPVLTANWLCEAYTRRSKCVPLSLGDGGKYGYHCQCQTNTGPDKRFGSLDNCRAHYPNKDSATSRSGVCPFGYAGNDCEMSINPWSEWSQWSACLPPCGRYRRRIRSRLCLGDFGCYGSAQSTKRCPPLECQRIHDPKTGDQVILGKTALSDYKSNGGFVVPATIDTLISVFVTTILCQIIVIALAIWLLWRREIKCVRDNFINMNKKPV